MSVIEQFKPILKSLDESMEVLESVPATARLALLAYLQLIALRIEKKAMKEYKNNEMTKADAQCILFAMQTKVQFNEELKEAINERNNDEENKN